MAAKLRARLSTGDEDIRWSKQGRQDLKDLVYKLSSKARRPELEPPRILFMGETGSGKSSFISSIVSALKGAIVYTSPVGEKEGDEVNTSKRYLEHRVFKEPESGGPDEPLNFILCDSRGIAKRNQQGAAEAEIGRLIEGKLRHGDLIDDEQGGPTRREVDDRVSKPPSCVVFVQKAQGLGDKDPDVQYKMDLANKIIKEKGIPTVVILTHIDMVKESLNAKLHLALSSTKIKERVEAASKQMGVNSNRVYVVKNYVHERRTHVRNDILILRAFSGILRDVEQRNNDRASRLPEERYEEEESRKRGYEATEPSENVDSAYSSLRHSSAFTDMSAADPKTTSVSQTGQAQRTESKRQSGRKRLTQPKTLDQREVKTPKDGGQTERSEKTFDYHISRNDSPKPNLSSSSDEKQYDFRDDDDDNDVDDGISLSDTYTSIQTELSQLQRVMKSLTIRPYPETYTERANLRGAKALHRKTVYRQNQFDITSYDKKTTGLNQELEKFFLGDRFYTDIQEVLQQWSGASTGAVWMSDTLHYDMGVPMNHQPPNSVDFQVLLLAPGCPALLLTIFDPERVLQGEDIDNSRKSRSLIEGETKGVELFTMRMGKLLTSAAFNFCSCDFVLVPCVMAFKDFSRSHLQQQVQKQVELTRQYFHGPRVLRETTYQQLKAAMTAVVGASYVPRLLDGKGGCGLSDEDDMVLMDFDWRGVVTLLIEKLTRSDSHQKTQRVTYSEKCWIKMAAAVLEAAKRLSFAEEVVIVTENEHMIQSCRSLKMKVKEETGLDLALTSSPKPPDAKKTMANYVIIIDLPICDVPENTVALQISRDQ